MQLKVFISSLVLFGAVFGVLWLERPVAVFVTPTPSVTALGNWEVIVEETPEPRQPEPRQNEAFIMPAAQPAYVPSRGADIIDPVVDANAAVVYHLETEKVLFAKNESVRAPIASLTKVLTALVVHEQLEPGDFVTIASTSVLVDGIRQTLNEGEIITVSDLVSLMLVESSNDAAYALAEHAHVRGVDLLGEMNAKAVSLGMADSLFIDPAGLDDTAYSTVNDLIRLVRAAVKVPDLWNVMLSPSLTVTSVDGTFVHIASNTNQLLGTIEGIRWGKTGNTDGALGCMLLVVKTSQDSDTLVSIILGSRARFDDTKLLVDWAGEAYGWH